MIESVKNLRDVIILTVFALSVFALLGLQIYMGVLTQKCIKNFTYWNELDHGSWGEGHQAWVQFNNNHTNWYRREEMKNYQLCGNSSGAGPCPEHYVCLEVFFTSSSFFQHFCLPPFSGISRTKSLYHSTSFQGFGDNPDNGYTNFDTFGWSFLCAFRLMTQDFWEDLYQAVLRF